MASSDEECVQVWYWSLYNGLGRDVDRNGGRTEKQTKRETAESLPNI